MLALDVLMTGCCCDSQVCAGWPGLPSILQTAGGLSLILDIKSTREPFFRSCRPRPEGARQADRPSQTSQRRLRWKSFSRALSLFHRPGVMHHIELYVYSYMIAGICDSLSPVEEKLERHSSDLICSLSFFLPSFLIRFFARSVLHKSDLLSSPNRHVKRTIHPVAWRCLILRPHRGHNPIHRRPRCHVLLEATPELWLNLISMTNSPCYFDVIFHITWVRPPSDI